MSSTIYYRVTNAAGELQVEGSKATCAEFLGVTPNTLYRATRFRPKLEYRGYLVEGIEGELAPRNSAKETAAIKAWDDFVTPIRKRYGIPVYKPPKDKPRKGG